MACTRWLEETLTDNGLVDCDQPNCGRTKLILVVGGDKGYKNMEPPGELAKLALTMTAQTEMDPEEEQDVAQGRKDAKDVQRKAKDKFADKSKYIIHTRFSHWRSLIERVIGRVKSVSRFVAGPLYLDTANKRLANVLVLVASLCNKALAKNKQLYSSDF